MYDGDSRSVSEVERTSRPYDYRETGAYAVVLRGDSMEPLLKRGMRLIVSLTQPIGDGDLRYVQLRSGERLAKIAARQGGGWLLSSANPAYSPRFVTMSKIPKVPWFAPGYRHTVRGETRAVAGRGGRWPREPVPRQDRRIADLQPGVVACRGRDAGRSHGRERGLANTRAEMVRLRNLVRPLRIPVDIIVVSEEEFRDWAHLSGTVLHWAASEGRVVHEATA